MEEFIEDISYDTRVVSLTCAAWYSSHLFVLYNNKIVLSFTQSELAEVVKSEQQPCYKATEITTST